MNKKVDQYKTQADEFIKKSIYDDKAKKSFDKAMKEINKRGGKAGIIDYLKNIFKRFHQGETAAILIVSSVIILSSSIWAYDNVHRQGVGPSVYDTNKEHVKEMKRAQEIYNWD